MACQCYPQGTQRFVSQPEARRTAVFETFSTTTQRGTHGTTNATMDSHWGQRQEHRKVTSLPAMIDKGKEHAAKMKPIAEKDLWRTIKLLSNKAPGLDGVGFDFLKALPYTAMKELVAFYHQVEATGTVPNQWLVSLVAMLPKSNEIERPIALVACTASRLRRIKTMKQRRKKAGGKTRKMNILKIPQRAVRLRLYKGSIQAGVSWGHQAMGLAPQIRQKLKAAMGRQMGLQRTGTSTSCSTCNPDTRTPHTRPSWSRSRSTTGSMATGRNTYKETWRKHGRSPKRGSSRPQVVRGPVAALICYLHDHGWTTDTYDLWTKPGHNGEDEYTLNMKSSWYYLVEELRRAQQRERAQSSQKRHDLQEVQNHLDWLPWRRLDKQSNTKVRTALQTWHQGAIFTKMAEGQEGKRLQCPHCGCAADAIHLLWQCKETNRHSPPLPSEVATELEQGINREFWAQGLVQRPPYQISTGGAAIQAWGSWTGLDEITLQPHDAITIGLATAKQRQSVEALRGHTPASHSFCRRDVPHGGNQHGAARQAVGCKSLVLRAPRDCSLCGFAVDGEGARALS